MSYVKIKGNESGTGIFTVESPNSSTDRTLTLPDQTGTIVNLDSSGNLLVGTTDTHPAGNNVTGTVITSDGWQSISAHSTAGIIVNRKTSDGNIIQLRKDSTTVGNIGVAAGDNIYFAGSTGSTGGIYINQAAVYPAAAGGAATDNLLDLGSATIRWKDLYLSGGAYIGGTGSSNYLDDYEEGTHSPTATGSGSVSGTIYYTKIGRLVTCSFYLSVSTTSFSGIGFSLPFSVISGGWSPSMCTTSASGISAIHCRANEGSSDAGVKYVSGDGGVTYSTLNGYWIIGKVQYFTS